MNTLKLYNDLCEIVDCEYYDAHVSDEYRGRTKLKIKKYLEKVKS